MVRLLNQWDDGLSWTDDDIWFEGLFHPELLPRNSTAAEFAMEQATARIAETGPAIRPLWNPDTCPVHLLPWLAWALGVDEWDPVWSESTKRNTIRESVSIHRRKGTVGSIRRALISSGYGDAEIIERRAVKLHDGTVPRDGSVNRTPPDHWAEYSVVMARPISIAQAASVRRILAATAPLRCHLRSLDFRAAAHLYGSRLPRDGTYTRGIA